MANTVSDMPHRFNGTPRRFLVILSCLLVSCLILFLSLHRRAVHAQSANLLTNAGFENGTTGWSYKPSTATFAITSTQPHSGSAAAYVTKIQAKGYAYAYQDVAVTAGSSYSLRGWAVLNDPAITHVRLRIEWRDSHGKIARPEVSLDQHQSEYQQLSLLNQVAPAGAIIARIECYAYFSRANPVIPAMFDDISFVEEIPVAPTATATPSPTATASPTRSPTASATATASPTATPTTSA
ncbi:MAG: hypothetical protein GXP41_00330, partial [Chloroflexi bacterium]|nr:hypothetical protein [Chloroflexota bacterium]